MWKPNLKKKKHLHEKIILTFRASVACDLIGIRCSWSQLQQEAMSIFFSISVHLVKCFSLHFNPELIAKMNDVKIITFSIERYHFPRSIVKWCDKATINAINLQ